ncbi:MAG: histidinol-phosphatase [Kordiimonadaceae bacterium]|nr:histidinol-phosphatase [Kordiimonadaceae bacterium]
MSDELSGIKIEALKAFACELADAAAEVSLAYFKKPLTVDNKEGDTGFDPVTEADKKAEKAIRALIDARFPDHSIFGEEYGKKITDSPFEWVLDPIDGTRAFISGLPTWGTLIALKHKGEPVIGVIDQPYLKERYLGWTTGATLNGRPITTRKAPSLDKTTVSTTDLALFTEGEYGAFQTLLKNSRLVRYGLDCYAYAVLSAGHIDIVAESGLKPYDMMALIPVVRGAGGTATNWEGNSAGDRGRLLAVGNPGLTAEIIEILANN